LSAAMGIVTLLRFLRPEKDPASWSTAGFACISLAAVLIVNAFIYLSAFRSFRGLSLHYFNVPAMVLMGVGGTLLWSAALARREQPDHPRLERLGRIGAGIAQLGFVFAFIQEIPSMGRTLSMSGATGFDASTFAMYSMVRMVVRILLLWASVEMMRTASDEDVIRRRLSKVHHLMTAWAVAMTINSAVIFLATRPNTPLALPLPQFWRNVVYVTVTVTAAFTLARRFRSLPKERVAEA